MARHISWLKECPRCRHEGVIHCERCNGSGRAIGDVADCRDCDGRGNLGPRSARVANTPVGGREKAAPPPHPEA